MLRWLDLHFKATPLVIIANFGLAMICATADAALPRDIVLLMADDVGCSDVACSPTMGLPLPNVARLAARGVTVTKASSSGPACVPTRVGTISENISREVEFTPMLRKVRHTIPYPCKR